jgi:hypothetical protein
LNKGLLLLLLKIVVFLLECGHILKFVFDRSCDLTPGTFCFEIKFVNIIEVNLLVTVFLINYLDQTLKLEIVVQHCDITLDCF